MGKASINGGVSIAMFDYWRVYAISKPGYNPGAANCQGPALVPSFRFPPCNTTSGFRHFSCSIPLKDSGVISPKLGLHHVTPLASSSNFRDPKKKSDDTN